MSGGRRISRVVTGLAISWAALTGAAAQSRANGRPYATRNVYPHPADPDIVYAAATYGFLKSSDGGRSFQWICEAAVGYGGVDDPDYAVSPDGDIYATTPLGLQVSRDGGCTFELAGFDDTMLISELEVGPDGRVWVATSTAARQNDIYVSDGKAGFQPTKLVQDRAWWTSLRTTAADLDRIYVSGLLPPETIDGDPAALLRRSVDGGQSWEVLPVDGFILDDSAQLQLAGVSPTDADLVFARAVGAAAFSGDVLYRSTDGGASWAAVTEFADNISAFQVRADGKTVLAATTRPCPEEIPTGGVIDGGAPASGCVRLSSDGGATWRRAASQPRLACLGESSDGLLYGCGANWEPDFFALGRSADGESWEKIYRFIETTGPLECPAGTIQARCAAEDWPALCDLFGICRRTDAGPVEQGGPGGDGGCCRVGEGSELGWIPGLLIVLVFFARSPAGRRSRRER